MIYGKRNLPLIGKCNLINHCNQVEIRYEEIILKRLHIPLVVFLFLPSIALIPIHWDYIVKVVKKTNYIHKWRSEKRTLLGVQTQGLHCVSNTILLGL